MNTHTHSLYDCICKCYDLNYKYKSLLKDKLKIDRNEEIDIKHIEKVESILPKDYKIIVYKDKRMKKKLYKNKDKKDSMYTINLIYNPDMSYSLVTFKYSNVKEIRKNKKIYVCTNSSHGTILLYDGNKVEDISNKEYKDLISKVKSRKIYINSKTTNIEDLIKFYDEHTLKVKKIIEYTNGAINLSKNKKLSDNILNEFYKSIPHIVPDYIREYEDDWIDHSVIGAIYFKKEYEGEKYRYDYNSFYMYCLIKNKYPMKKGTLITITKEEFNNLGWKIEYGIYRCIIKGEHPMFKLNNKNKYTHMDIFRARKLNLNVELIEDGDFNALIWTKDKLLSGKYIFQNYADKFYPLKLRYGHLYKEFKLIISTLWGVLCQYNYKIKYISNDNNDIFNTDNINMELISINDNITKVRYLNIKQYKKDSTKLFKTRFARIKPFILSFSKYTLTNYILDIGEDNIIEVMTDSIVSKINLDDKMNIGIEYIKNNRPVVKKC